MRKRYGKESEFVRKADKSVEAVKTWTEKIFHEDETADFQLPTEVWKWFVEVVIRAYEKAENDLVRRMILVKIIHTREVVRAGYDISETENKIAWNKYQVGTVCLLHDVARFDQALLGSFSDSETNYDHAVVGAGMIEKQGFGDDRGMHMEVVIEAVKRHSGFEYLGVDPYAKLTRDADKLALLRAMPEILEAQIGGFAEEGVTEAALATYKRGEKVRHEDMKTKADLFLAWLAWECDMNFGSTKKMFVDEGIKDWMMEELTSLLGVEL